VIDGLRCICKVYQLIDARESEKPEQSELKAKSLMKGLENGSNTEQTGSITARIINAVAKLRFNGRVAKAPRTIGKAV